ILNRQPDEPYALWLRGRALVHLQQEEKALDDFRLAVERAPEAFEIRFSLAQLLHKLGYVSAAIPYYELSRSERPDDERVVVALAHCYQEQAQLQTARSLLDELTSLTDYVPTLLERGRLALRLGQAEDAEKWARSAAHYKPDNTEAALLL